VEAPEGKQVLGVRKHQNVCWVKLLTDWREVLPKTGKLVQLETPINGEIIKKKGTQEKQADPSGQILSSLGDRRPLTPAGLRGCEET
jgi:hypothetical protein